ncbi:rapamycin-insensitive companion of mTOR-like [Macrobrachium nipponense]|uniref:rapamycin-insensitive companion of mTOR-like n=1 Tax=Macrobrachium nipponense TaxID=159736 RepID=UPI0030C86146
MYQGGRGYRIKSIRRRHESEEESIILDSEQGVSGILREVLPVLCRQDGVPKSRRLGYLNAAVKAIGKINAKNNAKTSPLQDELNKVFEDALPSKANGASPPPQLDFGEEKMSREQYFCLLRCCLVHEAKEVRAGGLRLIRYLVQMPEDVQALKTVNAVPLIIRSMDIMVDNQIERVQGLRLARRMLMVAPDFFPLALARCLAAIARDGAKERDRLLRSALATLNEMAILNTAVFVECGGISVLLHNVLDCAMPRINEALLGAILFLLNTPEWRPHCTQLHQILAPFSDFYYKHTSYDLDYYSKSEERELRTQAGRLAVLVALRSWPGLVSLCQPDTSALKSLIALLYLNHEETRRAIIELLYELFRVPLGEWTASYEDILSSHMCITTCDTDLWRLHEGFVAAEARILLPHIAKCRPNLIQNHMALVLYTMMSVDLFPALCEVIVSSSAHLSVRTTILLGELLHQANQNLPGECGYLSHSLPILLERSAGEDPLQRMRATQSITALLALARLRLSTPKRQNSLYLSHIIRCSPKSKENLPKVHTPSTSSKLSKWLGKDHDDLIHQTLKDSDVLVSGLDPEFWKWDLIIPILKWPSESVQKLEESNYKLFTRRLLHFYKPSAGLFANIDVTHDFAQVYAQALLYLCDFLLNGPEDDCSKYLEELLVDVTRNLGYVVCERPPHDAVLSPSHLNTTTSQHYFLLLGRLSHTQKGYDMLLRSGIFQQLLEIVSISNSDMYAKLICTCLDYSIDGIYGRSIFNKILTGCQESARMYATQFLRTLVRAGADNFAHWGIEMLVGQLNDESRLVALAALDVLDEACDEEEYLESVLNSPPSVLHLGDRGQLLMAKLVSSPRGFRAYHEANFINTLLDKWATTYNYKYVRLMQTALADSLTQHQRGEDGTYGRRSCSKHVVHDVFLLPHLYGSLTQHKEGFSVLMQHDAVKNMVQIAKNANVSTSQDIFELKVAIWAMGHIGLSSDGAGFLSCEGVLPALTHLAATCPVYSVRGTCFHALCLIATTKDGANLLRKFGWDSVRRHHHERWQFLEENFEGLHAPTCGHADENYINVRGHQMSESDFDDLEVSKGFYVGDDSDDGSDGGSLLVEGIGLDDPYPTSGKSQTLPHKSKPSPAMGHQRSLSDCQPVMEEQTTCDAPSSIPSHDDLTIGKRSSLRFTKLLSSIRRKSEKRRNSTSSYTSKSSTTSERVTDRVAAFLQTRKTKGESRSHSLTDPVGSDDDVGDHRYTISSESLSDAAGEGDLPLDNSAEETQGGYPIPYQTRTLLDTRLSPIASRASLSTMGSQLEGGVELRKGGRGGSIRGSSSALFAEDLICGSGGALTPVQSLTGTGGSYPLSTQSYLTLRCISNQHRRLISESSQEDKTSRNSLKGFLSSSYEQGVPYMFSNYAESRGMVRSPSGCSEVSSIRSGVRGVGFGGGMSRGFGSLALGGISTHQSGQCYLGLSLPLDLDLLLYDAVTDKSNTSHDNGVVLTANYSNGTLAKDRFPAITESELEAISEENSSNKKSISSTGIEKKNHLKSTNLETEGTGLELHTTSTCLACFSMMSPSPLIETSPLSQCESDGPILEVVAESPPLQRVKATNEVSEASESSSVNSQGWDDLGEGKTGTKKVNQVLIRKEILRFVTNLLSSIAAKSSESGLLALKQRWPQAFNDSCLYSEVCLILSSYSFRLTARRFVQELFMDMLLSEVFTEANKILTGKLDNVCETMNPIVTGSPPTVHSFSLQPPSMADIAEVTLSDKSDKEEEC